MSTRTIRPLESRDLPELRQVHARQCEQLGIDIPFPDPTEPHIFQVAVVEQDGVMLGALMFEAEVEIQAVGDNALMLDALADFASALEESLRLRNYKMYRAFAPRELVNREKGKERLAVLMRRLGMVKTDDRYVSYCKAL